MFVNLIIVFCRGIDTREFSSPATREPSWVLDSQPFVTLLGIETFSCLLTDLPYLVSTKSTFLLFSPPQQYNETNYQQHSAHGRLRSLTNITRRALKRGVAPCGDVVRLLLLKHRHVTISFHRTFPRYASLDVKMTEQVQILLKVESL